MPAFAICLLVLGQSATAPTVDRSGEAPLVEALTYFAGLKSASMTSNRYLAEVKGGSVAREAWFDLVWGGDGRYRYSYCDNWSEGLVVTSDGTSVMSDSLTPGRPVVLRKRTPFHNMPDLAPNTQGSLLLMLFDGPSVLPTLTSKDKELKVATRGELYTWTLQRPEGHSELTLKKVGATWQPVSLRIVKPDSGGRPWDPEETLDEVASFQVGGTFAKGMFDIAPVPGQRVNDLRRVESSRRPY